MKHHNHTFNKQPLFSKLLDITANAYKEIFRANVVDLCSQSLIHEIQTVKINLPKDGSIIIDSFINAKDLDSLLGDGHFDKAISFKQLCHEIETMVYDVLEQEFNALNFRKELDLNTGKIFIICMR